MQNLEQLRSAHALKWTAQHPTSGNPNPGSVRKHTGEGDCLSGYPSLIINNGLMAALSFSQEKEKQHIRVANAIADHLHKLKIAGNLAGNTSDVRSLIDSLSKADSLVLRRATDETLAFLSYLKRFAKS